MNSTARGHNVETPSLGSDPLSRSLGQPSAKRAKKDLGEWILKECMLKMLEIGFDPDIRDNSGETLLNHCIKTNKLESLKLLLSHKASSISKNQQGMSPLGQCLASHNLEALKIILNYECRQFEEQIVDNKISSKVLTMSKYFAKTLRIHGFYLQKMSRMLELIISRYNIEIAAKKDKEEFFK